MKTGNSKFLKEYNRSLILSLIRKGGGVSCAELSRLTGLRQKSVYEICAGLIQEEYIYESAIGESGGGRKPAILSLKPDSYFSIGIDIDVGFIRSVLMDTTGRVVRESALNADIGSYGEYLTLIADIINGLIRQNGVKKDRLLGVGVSVPGFIDANTMRIVMAPNLGFEDRDLINDLKAILPVEIYMENEAMASTVSEKWLGECTEDENFICINIKSGIGAGIYTLNRPYRGVKGSAGEIGHIPLDHNGPLCGCKNRGCLETLASTNAIIRNAKKVFGDGITIDELIRKAESGDKTAWNLFENAAEYLGTAIVFLVNIFNPSKIILGKDFTKYGRFELSAITDKVRSCALKPNSKSVAIKSSSLGERASVLGAAILPQKIIFKE